MNTHAPFTAMPEPAESAVTGEHIAPAPRVSVQAFCETVEAQVVV